MSMDLSSDNFCVILDYWEILIVITIYIEKCYVFKKHFKIFKKTDRSVSPKPKKQRNKKQQLRNRPKPCISVLKNTNKYI